ncbi:substrate binding domain-containing protein, partial [Klebsiella pneumoniae]
QFDLTLTDDFIDPHRDATDILFRISSLPDAGYHARVFGSQRYYLTASPEYVSRYGSPTSPEALHQHRTLVYGGSQGANRWLFRQREEAWVHYPLTPLMTSNNADALLTSAIGGMGIVLFPDWMVSEALHNGTLVTLMDRYSAAISHTPSYIAAIYPYTRHPSLNVRTVIDYFADVFGSPPYWQR